MFDDQVLPAVFAHLADIGSVVQHHGKDGVEEADGNFVGVVLEPFVKDGAEKITPLLATYGEWLEVAVGVELDAFDVLVKMNSVIAEVVVDFQWPRYIIIVDEGKYVVLNALLLEYVDRLENLGVATVSAYEASVVVMDVGWAIEGYAYQKLVLCEVYRQFLVDESAVGLESIGN